MCVLNPLRPEQQGEGRRCKHKRAVLMHVKVGFSCERVHSAMHRRPTCGRGATLPGILDSSYLGTFRYRRCVRIGAVRSRCRIREKCTFTEPAIAASSNQFLALRPNVPKETFATEELRLPHSIGKFFRCGCTTDAASDSYSDATPAHH